MVICARRRRSDQGNESRPRRPVVPIRNVLNQKIFVKEATDGTPTPVVRRVQPELVVLVGIALLDPESRDRREAGSVWCAVGNRLLRSRYDAGVVIAVRAAVVVGVIGDLIDFAHEVTSRVHGLERADTAVQGPCGVLEAVLVILRREDI